MTLFWRIFLLNAAVLTVATALLLGPVTVSTPVLLTEALILSVGLASMLVANGVLLPRVRVARPCLAEASETLGETIHLARLDRGDVVYLATRESHEYPRTLSRVGRRLPAHVGALGKALLAERPDGELPLPEGPLRSLTRHSHTDRAALLADLAQVRERGYAVDREESVEGIAGFGFALRDDVPASDAVSCSVPVGRLTEEHERRIVAVMREIRDGIETAGPHAAGSGAPDWR